MEESLGKKLIAARESKGITVDDAVYLEKFPRDVITALESESFGFFSSPLYARSFLKQYGDYVGASVEPWLDDLVPISLIDGESLESYIDMQEPAIGPNPEQDVQTSVSPSNSGMATVWMVVITAALLFGGFKAYQKIAAVNEVEQADEQSKVETKETAATNPTVQKVETTNDATSQEPTNEPTEAEPNIQVETAKRAIVVELPED